MVTRTDEQRTSQAEEVKATGHSVKQASSASKAAQRGRWANRAAHGGDTDLDAYIAELVSRAPPLTSEQRDKLALLLGNRHRSQ